MNYDTSCEENVVTSEISFFVEHLEVTTFVHGLCDINWQHTWRERWEWFTITISKYQEQSNILNPHLEEIVSPLTECMLKIIRTFPIASSGVAQFQVFFLIFYSKFLVF